MKVVVVGAGAVGQVYGQALRRGGAELSFLVREKHADEARRGYTMWRLAPGRAPRRERLEGFGVATRAADLRGQGVDQVWLAMSATGLAGPWLEEVAAATGDATVVCLQPGPESVARVRAVAGDRVVAGVISFIAYQAPLPRESRIPEPGVAYWLPPTPSPFSGDRARVQAVVKALRAGGCPATSTRDVARESAFATVYLQAHVAALDASGWRFSAARRGDALRLAHGAFRQSAAIAARSLDLRPPLWTRLVGPWTGGLVLAWAPRLLPLDVPTYFAYHFTKVGDQTRAHVDHWIAEGRRLGMDVDVLVELRQRLGQAASFDPDADYR